jgi:ferredoxin-NADP reductase
MSLSGPHPDTVYKKLVVDHIREETKNFKTFVFAPGHQISYQAGQFITLVDSSGLQEIRRSYSILSSPVLHESLSISVKRIDNGFFSRKLIDRTKIGNFFLTTGSAGFFRLPEQMEKFTNIFFFAAGSGIVPIFSLLKTVLHLFPDISVHLIYSNQSKATTAFYDELKWWESRFSKNLHIDFIFSSYPELSKARLNRELLLELVRVGNFNRGTTLFYTCGPENYMRMVIFNLKEEGFPEEHIRKEDFNPGNKKATPRLPPDKNNYYVKLELQGIYHDFPVIYPDSILQAARKRKLSLPFSCETGKCGSCAGLCISGNVWLSHNEVLTESDLAKGLTLTCTGHPQNGNVILKID